MARAGCPGALEAVARSSSPCDRRADRLHWRGLWGTCTAFVGIQEPVGDTVRASWAAFRVKKPSLGRYYLLLQWAIPVGWARRPNTGTRGSPRRPRAAILRQAIRIQSTGRVNFNPSRVIAVRLSDAGAGGGSRRRSRRRRTPGRSGTVHRAARPRAAPEPRGQYERGDRHAVDAGDVAARGVEVHRKGFIARADEVRPRGDAAAREPPLGRPDVEGESGHGAPRHPAG